MQKPSVAHASLIKPQKRCDAALAHEFIQLFAKRRSSSVAPRRSYAKSLNSPNTGARRSLPHTPYVRNRPLRGGLHIGKQACFGCSTHTLYTHTTAICCPKIFASNLPTLTWKYHEFPRTADIYSATC